VAAFQGLIFGSTGIKHLQSTYNIQEQERAVQLAHKNTKGKCELCNQHTCLHPHLEPLSDENPFATAFKNWLISISEYEKQGI